jgi:hypothetical protein
MSGFETGFLTLVVTALTVFALVLAYASAVAGGSSAKATQSPANTNETDEKRAA